MVLVYEESSAGGKPGVETIMINEHQKQERENRYVRALVVDNGESAHPPMSSVLGILLAFALRT